MPRKFMHIGCTFTSTPKTFQVDYALNANGDDWVRYAMNNWIVWSEKSAPDLCALIKPCLTIDDQILVTALDLSDRSGYLSPWLWQWIDNKRVGQDKSLADILGAALGGASPYGLGGLSSSTPLTGLAAALASSTPQRTTQNPSALAALASLYSTPSKKS